MMTLYQFELSHYCEKVRWALDYKGISYKRKTLIPGPHARVTKKLAPKTCVPIVVCKDKAVQDSTAIISYLDERFAEHPLTPHDSNQAKQALEWEEYFDEEIGIAVRLWWYYYTLPDRSLATSFLLRGAPWYGRALYALIFPKVRSIMREMMDIHADSVKRAEQRLLAAFETLNNELKDRRFLVGDSFSRADLTACALLSPLCRLGESDTLGVTTNLPQPVTALRDAHRSDRFFTWALDTYEEYRQMPSTHGQGGPP